MSVRDFFDNDTQTFIMPNLSCDNIDCLTINGSSVGGGGDSGISSIVCNDGSVNIATNGGTITLSDAGSNIFNTPVNSIITMNNNIDMNNNNIVNCNEIELGGKISITNNGSNFVLQITDGPTTSNVYDSVFNQPTLSNVIQTSSNASGQSITNLNSLQVSSITGVSTINGSSYPPSSSSSATSISYMLPSSGPDYQQITNNSNTILVWTTADNANTLGTCPIQMSSGSNYKFQNNASSAKLINVSGYISIEQMQAGATLAVWVIRNGLDTDRYCFNHAYCPNMGNVSLNFAGNLVMQAGDTIQCMIWTDVGPYIAVSSLNNPAGRFTITCLN